MTDTAFPCITSASTQNNSFTLSRDAICSSKTQTVNHCTVHKPKRKGASDQQLPQKPDNFQVLLRLNSLQAGQTVNRIPAGRDFAHPSRPTLGLTMPPIQWMLGLFLRGKAGMEWRWPPTPPSAKVQNKEYRYTSTPPLGLFGLF